MLLSPFALLFVQLTTMPIQLIEYAMLEDHALLHQLNITQMILKGYVSRVALRTILLIQRMEDVSYIVVQQIISLIQLQGYVSKAAQLDIFDPILLKAVLKHAHLDILLILILGTALKYAP